MMPEAEKQLDYVFPKQLVVLAFWRVVCRTNLM
jgi:hypothetical protein